MPGRARLGWTALSERELQRIQVLSEVMSQARTVASASMVRVVSTRQVHRLLKAYRSDGAGSLAHKGRGRPSNNRIQPDAVAGPPSAGSPRSARRADGSASEDGAKRFSSKTS